MKYASAGLLKASAGRGWAGVGAELLVHAAGVILERKTSPDTELAIAVGGPTDVVIRRASGRIKDECVAVPGTVWTCPAGTQEDFVECSGTTPPILHIFMPASSFGGMVEDSRRGADALANIRYERGFPDPLIAACGLSVAQELNEETSAGAMLIEAIGNVIAARLIHSNTGIVPEDI